MTEKDIFLKSEKCQFYSTLNALSLSRWQKYKEISTKVDTF